MKIGDELDEETDAALLPSTVPRGVTPVPSGPERLVMNTSPVTIVPAAAVEQASQHGAVMVATLVSSSVAWYVHLCTRRTASLIDFKWVESKTAFLNAHRTVYSDPGSGAMRRPSVALTEPYAWKHLSTHMSRFPKQRCT